MTEAPCRLFLVAGEHSGDQLGARLIEALRRLSGRPLEMAGVGGEAMAAAGCSSLFPLADIAVMGPTEIIPRLPVLVRRMRQTVRAIEAMRPHALVILDSPEFTHPLARRARRRLPGLPVLDYVSPSVWAWRPGRARRMRGYIDHVLAILPFEPDVHARLGGPPCTYVGHPLIERLEWMRSRDPAALAARFGLDPARPTLVVLPGSRPNEVRRLMAPFGGAMGLLLQANGALQVLLPVVESVRGLIESGLADWPLRPHLIEDEDDKFAAFRLARAALAASGTVTLELALSGTPMVVAYKVDALSWRLRFLVKVPSIVLPNLILGENAFPELLQDACTPERLAAELSPLLRDGEARRRQLAALSGIAQRMALPSGEPSERAAAIVLQHAGCSAAPQR